MSTMLVTTNPEAANDLDPTKDRRSPYMGQTVIFYSNETRMGRRQFPATVMWVEDDDHIDLLVMLDAGDEIYRRKIPRKTDQNNINCWSFNEWDDKHYQIDALSLDAMVTAGSTHVAVSELRKELDALHEVVKKIDRRTAKK